MTTIAATLHRRPTARIAAVTRLYLVNKWLYLALPWVIMGIATAFSLVITLLIRAAAGPDSAEALDGMAYSWAVLSPFWYLVVAGVMAISATFPFAMALTLTRREFYLGTALMFAGVSALNGIGFTVLTELERATSGWGLGMHMFTALWLGGAPWYVNLLSYFALQMFTLFIGASVATVYMRWRITGMFVFWVALAALVLALLALVILTGSGPALVDWFVSIGVAGVFALVLAIAVAAAAAGFAVLRRATVKNA